MTALTRNFNLPLRSLCWVNLSGEKSLLLVAGGPGNENKDSHQQNSIQIVSLDNNNTISVLQTILTNQYEGNLSFHAISHGNIKVLFKLKN